MYRVFYRLFGVIMYAIINKRTKKWVYGTWWQDGRRVQRTSSERLLTYERREDAELDFHCRRCGRDYQIVQVKVEVIT